VYVLVDGICFGLVDGCMFWWGGWVIGYITVCFGRVDECVLVSGVDDCMF